MAEFIDTYLPAAIPGYPCMTSPKTSTTTTVASSGDEGRNRNWQHPLRKFKLPQAEARKWEVIDQLSKLFLVLGGPFSNFAFRDPMDFASVDLVGPNENQAFVLRRVTATDQVFGTGDGFARVFQLTKTYAYGPAAYVRPIGLPVLDTLLVADAGTPTEAFSVTRPGGVVTFDVAPLAGHSLTWGGLFDVPVRFDSDDALDTIIQAFLVGGAAEINLDEQRLCT